MSDATFNTDEIVEIDRTLIDDLKTQAQTASQRRARFCLHRSTEDAVQEMVIAFCRDSRVPPHRHPNKSESFHIIEGEALVTIYDDDGRRLRTIVLGAPGSSKPFMYRLSSGHWHTVEPLTDFLVLHETAQGPFRGDEGGVPAWAAREPRG